MTHTISTKDDAAVPGRCLPPTCFVHIALAIFKGFFLSFVHFCVSIVDALKLDISFDPDYLLT